MKAYLDVVDMVAIPDSAEHWIPEAEHQHVLDHLLPQIMVNSKDFVFTPVGR